MNCAHCQHELLAYDRFCPACGAVVAGSVAGPPTDLVPADSGPLEAPPLTLAHPAVAAPPAPQPPPPLPPFPSALHPMPTVNVAAASQSVNVNVNLPLVVAPPAGPGCLVRGIWYLFVGWWLAAWVIVLGYLACPPSSASRSRSGCSTGCRRC